MRIKNVIVIFNHLLNIKESYLIAKGGEKNAYVILKYIEAILTIMNPICPHFCQYVWQTHVLPTLRKSSNLSKEPNEMLLNNGWPQSDAPSQDLSDMLKYLEHTKREIRLALDKANT